MYSKKRCQGQQKQSIQVQPSPPFQNEQGSMGCNPSSANTLVHGQLSAGIVLYPAQTSPFCVTSCTDITKHDAATHSCGTVATLAAQFPLCTSPQKDRLLNNGPMLHDAVQCRSAASWFANSTLPNGVAAQYAAFKASYSSKLHSLAVTTFAWLRLQKCGCSDWPGAHARNMFIQPEVDEPMGNPSTLWLARGQTVPGAGAGTSF